MIGCSYLHDGSWVVSCLIRQGPVLSALNFLQLIGHIRLEDFHQWSLYIALTQQSILSFTDLLVVCMHAYLQLHTVVSTDDRWRCSGHDATAVASWPFFVQRSF